MDSSRRTVARGVYSNRNTPEGGRRETRGLPAPSDRPRRRQHGTQGAVRGCSPRPRAAPRAAHAPYQVHQTLKQRGDDRLASITAGSVYHAMDRLEAEGYVDVVGTDREGNRPQRTTYRLTAAGHDAFVARTARLLGEPRREHASLPVALSQAHAIDRATAVAALRARRTATAAELDTHTRRYDVVRSHGLPAVSCSTSSTTSTGSSPSCPGSTACSLTSTPPPWTGTSPSRSPSVTSSPPASGPPEGLAP
ncbi:PadR family transcriptional regulator [Oerskovia sp. M15]